MKHRVRFPIGDWSNDGHGRCKYYNVQSSLSGAELGAIHIQVPEKLGFDIGDICRFYEEQNVKEEIVEKLRTANFPVDNFVEKAGEGEYEGYYFIDDYDPEKKLLEMWLAILNFIEPFEYEIEEEPKESIHGYGGPVNTPGYGLFL